MLIKCCWVAKCLEKLFYEMMYNDIKLYNFSDNLKKLRSNALRVTTVARQLALVWPEAFKFPLVVKIYIS